MQTKHSKLLAASNDVAIETIERKMLFPIVAIGVSDESLPALSLLLQHLPKGLGVAYILVRHQPFKQELALNSLLEKNTNLPVLTITEAIFVKPDHLYVVPPDVYVTTINEKFTLLPFSKINIGYYALDLVLITLAKKLKELAFGILLDNLSVECTEGIKYIKAEGGVTFGLQATTQHNQDDISGCTDINCTPETLAAIVESTIRRPYNILAETAMGLSENELQKVLEFVQARKGVDLSFYKQDIIRRRIARRMMIADTPRLAGYLEKLKNNFAELNALHSDLMLNTNMFFQELSIYQVLTKTIFPALLKKRKPDDPIRIWCPTCNTGEEVISIAIYLFEYLKSKEIDVPVQIFGTDLNEEAIKKARTGVYPAITLQNVSPQRLKRFFIKTDNNNYRIIKSIRDNCVFASQNLLKDPPFSRIDIISCQNALVNFEAGPNKKILQSLHYSLKVDGVLILNKSENLDTEALFNQFEDEPNFYTKKQDTTTNTGLGFSYNTHYKTEAGGHLPKEKKEVNTLDIDVASEQLLLSRYVPASIVIDSNYNILRFHGPVHKYLHPASGKASLSVLKMVDEGVAAALKEIVEQVAKQKRVVRKEGTVLELNGNETSITIEVAPIPAATSTNCYLVLFEERRNSSHTAVIHKLEETETASPKQKLAEAGNEMQQLSDEFDAIQQKLQADAEELSSDNQELQSINQSLKDENQELQAAIEKLSATNEELLLQNNKLVDSVGFSSNIIESIREPLALLNTNLSVHTANKAFYAAFKLTPSDIEGRFLYEIGDSRWNIPELMAKLSDVADRKNASATFELTLFDNKIYLFNATNIEAGYRGSNWIMITIQDITQHRQIREAKEWLVAVVQSAAEGIISFTVNRTIISWNKGAEKIFGYTEAEMMCKSISRLVRQQDKLGQQKTVQRAINGETIQQLEAIYLHKDGHLINVSISISPIKDERGNIKGLMASLQDITERKKVEEALRESEERYRHVVSESAVGIGRSNFDGQLTFVNQKFADMLGFTEDEILSKSVWDITINSYVAQEKQVFRRLLEQNASFEYEKQLIRKDGKLLWVSISLSAIKDANGKPVSITAVIIDISQRKEAEAELQKTKESLQLALEAANMGTWEVDMANGKASYHSLRNDQIFGYSTWQPEWNINMARVNVINEDKHLFDEALQKFTERGRLQMEVRVKWPDESIHWIHKVGRVFYNDKGEPQRAAGVAMDITDRKLVEQRKEEFISIASHELKTPVTSIKAYAQILQEQFLEEEDFISANMLGKLDKQVDKLTGLIRDMLDTTRITEGQLMLHPEIFDMNSLIKEVADEMQLTALQHEIVKDLQPIPPVEADKERIRQVIVNLLSNAVKYSPKANKVIIRSAREGNTVQVSIQDFGIGMSDEASQKVFDRFYRVSSTKIKAYPGLGLGLFISSEIIKLHNGTIGVKSKENEGSTFYFSLPLNKKN